MKNLFIVFEHIDGAGGSTQVKMLSNWIRENTMLKVDNGFEPTDKPIGKLLRNVLQKKIEISNNDVLTGLFISDRYEHNLDIDSSFESNDVYICDRYYYSNIAYNSKDILDMRRIEEYNSIFRKPDICFYLDIPSEVAMSRIEKRGEPKEIFEKVGYLEGVRNRYRILCADNKMIYINGNQEPEKVFSDILKEIKKYIDTI